MTELELDREVRAMCAKLDIWLFRSGDPRRDTLRGWPDLVLLGRGGILYRELKGIETRTTTDQLKVGNRVLLACGDWAVWQPQDLRSGRIRRELAEIAYSPKAER